MTHNTEKGVPVSIQTARVDPETRARIYSEGYEAAVQRILSLAEKHANSRKTPAGPYVDSVTLKELACIARGQV